MPVRRVSGKAGVHLAMAVELDKLEGAIGCGWNPGLDHGVDGLGDKCLHALRGVLAGAHSCELEQVLGAADVADASDTGLVGENSVVQGSGGRGSIEIVAHDLQRWVSDNTGVDSGKRHLVEDRLRSRVDVKWRQVLGRRLAGKEEPFGLDARGFARGALVARLGI